MLMRFPSDALSENLVDGHMCQTLAAVTESSSL